MEPWQAGAIAGITSRCLTAPIDLLKIRLQLNPQKRLLKLIHGIYKTEGVTAFWKGNLPGIALYASYSGIQFFVIEKHLTGMKLVDGALASVIAYTITYPFDLLRTHLAIRKNSTALKLTPFTLISITDLFRGITPSLVQIAPYMGLVFHFEHLLSPHMPHYLSGFLAGALSKSVLLPLDVIKRRMQTQNLALLKGEYAVSLPPKYPQGIMSTGRAILRNEGLKTLWSGWSISILKSAPATAITFHVYNLLTSVYE